MTKNLVIRAGKKAYQTVRESGFTPDKIKILAGAAGGPKWLVLSQFDQLMISDWFSKREEPIQLIGSSIGSWRFAALAQKAPSEAIGAFQERYINQFYTANPTTEEVSREAEVILNTFLPNQRITEILDNPIFKLNILSVRCRGLNALHNKPGLTAGLIIAAAANAVSRKTLGLFFERTLFSVDQSKAVISQEKAGFSHIQLTKDNLKTALMASGSIPTVMEGVSFGSHGPAGVYRDGGLMDYHLDIPFQTPADEDIVFYPHFIDKIIPGWLDKPLKNRKPSPRNTEKVLLLAPSREFVESLPYQKIPDRKDFNLFVNDDKERIRYWQTVVNRSKEFANEAMDILTSSKLKQVIQPL